MAESKTVEIEPGRFVGLGHACYIIAEIGSNHNQNFDLARRHVDAAADAGVDAVKFQTFRAREHYSKRTPDFTYLKGQSTYDLIASVELDRSWHQPLKEHAANAGVTFLSSACDIEAIDDLDRLGMPAFKVASFDLPDIFLLHKMAATGKPVILSTGMASWADIQMAVSTCRDAGNEKIVLLQCTSLYPAPAELSNLRAMHAMEVAFNLPTGYSDHTQGEHIPLAAVALGACVIEKHFTLDRTLPGPDHPFAMEPEELKLMVRHIRDVEASLGDGCKEGPRPEEHEMFEKGRRSLHARTAIPEGVEIRAEMLTVKRPGFGISPHLMEHVVGRVARQSIGEDESIRWEMI